MDRQASFMVDAKQHATHRLLVDGEWVNGEGPWVSVYDKYRLQPFATITVVDAAQVRQAVETRLTALVKAVPFGNPQDPGTVVGSVISEDAAIRVDLMPYGGSKDSGFGREGPYYAVREMTEERSVTFTTC